MIDAEERAIVSEVGDWMERFGDAIHGTRPWHIFGEGPTEVVSGMFGESAAKPFTSADLRFTTRSGDLFATTLGAPGDVVTIEALGDAGQFADRRIDRVEVVGNPAPLNFKRDVAGLQIELPAQAVHKFGVAFRVVGAGLVGPH